MNKPWAHHHASASADGLTQLAGKRSSLGGRATEPWTDGLRPMLVRDVQAPAVLLATVALASCSQTSQMAEDSTVAKSPGAVLSVRELVSQVAVGEQATVTGGLVLRDGRAVLCDEQEESEPPICRTDPEQAVALRDFDLDELDVIERGEVSYASLTLRVTVIEPGLVDVVQVE